jgi:hypothetical protein
MRVSKVSALDWDCRDGLEPSQESQAFNPRLIPCFGAESAAKWEIGFLYALVVSSTSRNAKLVSMRVTPGSRLSSF